MIIKGNLILLNREGEAFSFPLKNLVGTTIEIEVVNGSECARVLYGYYSNEEPEYFKTTSSRLTGLPDHLDGKYVLDAPAYCFWNECYYLVAQLEPKIIFNGFARLQFMKAYKSSVNAELDKLRGVLR